MALMPNPLQAVQQGQNWIDGLFQQQANRQAGSQLAGGDYTGAANTQFRSGNLQGGQALLNQQRVNTTNQQADTDRQRAQQLATTRQVITALSRAAQQGDDVGLLVEEFRPTFRAMGTPDEDYDRIANQVRSNPAILDQFGALIDREIQVVNLGNGGWASVDKQTGQRVAGDDPTFRPTVVGGVALGQDLQPVFDSRTPEYFETESGGAPVIVGIGPNGQTTEAWRGEAAGPEVRTLSQDEVAALGLSPGSVYQADRSGRITPVSGQGGDRLSAGQQRQVESYYQEIAGLENIGSELNRFDSMIANGELELSPVANAVGGARNALGMSSENSRNLAEFRATLERIRNDSLRLNNGVQTEGDSKRAWEELIANINDPAVVRRQIARINNINQRALAFRQQRIRNLEGGSRQQPAQPQTRSRADGPPAQSIGSRENPYRLNPRDPNVGWNRIPSGGYFQHPDGSIRRKP